MKKTGTSLIGGLMAALLALVLAGCGGSATDTSSADDAGSSAQSSEVPTQSSVTPPPSSASASGSSSCTPAHTGFETLKPGTLQVLVYVSPPYTTKNDDSFGGVDSEIVKKLAAMECLKVQMKPVAPAALIASVKSARADVAIGGIYYTKKRAKTLSLSAPMYRDGMALLSTSELSGNLSDLKDKSVGVIQGYLWDEDIKNALGEDHVKTYQASAGMITDIRNGRLDVAVLTSAEAGYRASKHSELKVTQLNQTPKVEASKAQNNVVLATPKKEHSLTSVLSEDIKKLVKEGTVASVLKANGMDPSLAGSRS